MKIVLLNDRFSRSAGGSEAMAYHMAESIRAAGHDCRALATDAGAPPGDAMPPGVEAAGLDPSPMLRVPVLRHYARMRALARRLRSECADADAFWCFCLGPVPAARRVAAGRPVLFFQPASPLYLMHSARAGRTSLAGRLVRAYEARRWSVLERRSIERCSALVHPSRSRQEEVLGYYGEAFRPKCHVVPPGVDLERFRPSGRAWDGKGPMRTLTVCRLSWEKNLPCLIRAAAILKKRDIPVESVIVGDGDQRAELERLAADEGVRDRVTFEGRRQDVERFYREADVFVLPSVYEGFGLVYLEAMASGLPCVAIRNVPGRILVAADEIIENGRTGLLVDDDSPELLADALAEMFRNPERAKEWGLNARRVCEERFTWGESARRALDITAATASRG